jgi:hypothetical protein
MQVVSEVPACGKNLSIVLAYNRSSKTDIKRPVEGNEKGIDRKTGTRYPLSDMRCCSGEKV